ncbi:MAG: hypothetical protein KGQ59_00120 [Bdellovibrionales bacterium]|nr:hypothetical protein [Bdellovibrionales bacterium]
MRALVGISGGPKSMVTAWLLKKQGMQVTGVHIDVFSNEGNRVRIHEMEKKLGIQIQVLDLAAVAGEFFLEERTTARFSGFPFFAKSLFQKKILFPELIRLSGHSGSEKIATGHMVTLQDDPASRVVRVVLGPDSPMDPIFEILGLGQETLSRWIAPIGAIPRTLLEKLVAEVAPATMTGNFEFDWKSLEVRLDSSDPSLLARELQVFTTAGVLLGRAVLGSLKVGRQYLDPEDPGKTYRIVDLQPKSDRVFVQESDQIVTEEFHFDEGHWFTDADPGMGFLDVGMISSEIRAPRMIRLIQYEGGRLKGVVSEPLRGDDARILKGASVLFLSGTEVLGGARVMKAR